MIELCAVNTNVAMPNHLRLGQAFSFRSILERTMNKYRNVHLWMVLVFITVLLGFARGYWSQFSEAPFGHHLHMFSALLWFALVMSQPYLATRGSIRTHRRNGMLGLFVAGLVVASAMLMLPSNIEKAAALEEGGFVGKTFLYGVTFLDLVSILAFSLCIVMAMLRSRKTDEHAMWMIASVYTIFAPAFARLMVFPLAMVFGFENLTFIKVLIISTPLVLVFILVTAWRFRQLHPALIFALIVNLSGLVVGPVGRSAAWRSLCDALFA